MVGILREPSLQLAPGAADAASEHVLFLLPRILLLDQQVRDVERRIARVLKELPENADVDCSKPRHVDLLLSLPGLGPIIASTILSEASRPIRERDCHALRCYAGTAPSPKQSGKRRMVSTRHACSARIRQAVFYWSSRSIMFNARSRQHYDRLRAAGHPHARALRGIADRLLVLLIAILKAGIPYDAARRRSSSHETNCIQE